MPTPIAEDDFFSGTEDNNITGNLLTDNGTGADSDPDGDTITAFATTINTPAGGTATISENGDFTYIPFLDFYGTDSFSYSITDEEGLTDTATVTLELAEIKDINGTLHCFFLI